MSTLAREVEGVPTITDSTERATRFPTPATGQKIYRQDLGIIERWDGSAWVSDIVYAVAGAETGVVDARYPFGHVKRYGAVGDGVTDDTTAIQNAIDNVIYHLGSDQRNVVQLGPGSFKITRTIHLGYGTDFRAVVVEGEGVYRFVGSSSMTGTAIIPTFHNAPAFNVQGARGTKIRNISFIGQLGAYIIAHGMGTLTGADIDDTDPASWDDPGLGGATLDSRYAPYAAITIDAYSGVRPGTSYPDVTYPAFLGAVAQYGKNFSSDVLIDGCYIEGFTVGIANQPSDADGNGDFTQVNRCNMVECKWGISIGNTQSRNVAITDTKFALMFAFMTNRRHGRQTGKFGGVVKDLSGGASINIVDFEGGYAGPVTFINAYVEDNWRIGDIGSSGVSNHGFIFIGCQFDFGSQNDTRGYPSNICGTAPGSSGGNPLDLQFIGCTFAGYKSTCQIGTPGVALQGCYMIPTSPRTNPYEKIAHNALGGGLVTYQLGSPRRSRIRFSHYDLDAGTDLGVVFTDQWASSRAKGVPIYAENSSGLNDANDSVGRPPSRIEGIAKSSLSALTLVNGVLTITFTARADYIFRQYGPLPGDLIWDDTTGSVFFVRSRAALVVIAELQNNYKLVAGVKTPIAAFSTSAGNLYFRNARIYQPATYLEGDLTAASAVITNAGRDDGFAGYSEMTIGDSVLVLETIDAGVRVDGADITAVNTGARTFTVSVVISAGRTQVRRRFPWFIRKEPANV